MRAGRSRSALFLMELILSVGLLSLSAALSTQLFVAAHRISLKSEALTHAMLLADSAAEGFKAAEGDLGSLSELISGKTEGGRLTVYYDADWKVTHAGLPGGYTLVIESRPEPRLISASVRVNDEGGAELYSIKVKREVHR